MIVIQLFRDVLDGVWYWLYLLVCIFAFFYVLGIIGDNKRAKINKKLKEKKTYDIESGKEAAIAAMETKQILTVGDDAEMSGMTLGDMANNNTKVDEMKKEEKEEVPSVMILNSDGQTSNQPGQTTPQIQPAVQPVVQPVAQPTVQPSVVPIVQPGIQAPDAEPKKAEEPLVLNSSTN